MKDLKYLLAYSAPLLGYLGLRLGGWWTWGVVLEAFVFIPFFELFYKGSSRNLSPEEESKKEGAVFFDLLLYLHLPLLYFLLLLFFRQLPGYFGDPFELTGMTLSMGILTGTFGINVAHELGHRANRLEQALAKVLLMPALYMHFFIEHNLGHHKHVATDLDPASARLGESLYAFWIRSVSGGYLSAWRLENRRLKKSGRSFFSLGNQMVVFHFLQLIYLSVVFLFFGSHAFFFALLVALIAILLLETVNYIEHYGLRRKLLESGRFEKVDMRHSWNSNHELGRILLYELTRHADHHYKASRPYQVLRHFDGSPQLPFGYPGAILLSLVPPLWFRVMDPRVQRVRDLAG